jgi:hypothetical protein
MLRVQPALVEALREQAKTERRTMSSVGTYAIQSYLEHAKEEAARQPKKRTAFHSST